MLSWADKIIWKKSRLDLSPVVGISVVKQFAGVVIRESLKSETQM